MARGGAGRCVNPVRGRRDRGGQMARHPVRAWLCLRKRPFIQIRDRKIRYCRHEMWQNGAPVTNFMIACQKPSIATTFQTGTGNCSSRTYLGEPVFGAELRRTTANSSTQCSGFFAPARRGETCRSRMGGGKTPIDAFAVGATRVFGSRYWKSSLSSPITNGS